MPGAHNDGVRSRPRVRVGAAVGLTALFAAALAILVVGLGAPDTNRRRDTAKISTGRRAAATVHTPRSHAPSAPTAPTTTTTNVPSINRRLHLAQTISGDISPKSVDASGSGLFVAQNMMYKHTITVYDASGALVKTIPDTVQLASFGITGHPGESHGAPVEAAFTPDGKDVYVSNYSMYGAGFGPEGNDNCPSDNSIDPSFVYRVDLATLAIDKVVPVGKVPKYVAVTSDGRYVLVTNWCSYDMSVIDRRTDTEIKRIPLGPYPRGIAVDPTSSTAYVAVMGTHDVAKVDLGTFAVGWIRGVGNAPRHAVMSPDGHYLYVTLNGAGEIAKIDLTNDGIAARVSTGSQPRSMAISADGLSLYVVNYDSSTLTKVSATDMTVLQNVPTNGHPIGITYDRQTGNVWVACYSGVIEVFADA